MEYGTLGQTILVTGCAGFIGSRVTEMLLDQGYRVVGVDNLNDAYDVRLKHWRLARLARPGFEFNELDVRDRAALQAVFETTPTPAIVGVVPTNGTNGRHALPSAPALSPFSAVINLAARAGVRPSVADPWLYVETNTTGTLNLLELCREYGVPKFVLASTSSLYGRDNPQPWQEDANTDRPLSPYAASKKAAEVLCHAYHYLHGLDITILRYFTVYGPAGRPDMSLFRFVQWISEGRPVVIYGDGRQSRDFTYVDDIARGTIAGLKPLGFAVINLGSDTPVVLLDAIRLIERLLGQRACLQFTDRHQADVPGSWADVRRARELLGWRPTTRFETGVQRLVDWYSEERAWASELLT